jgi:CBS domain-containing protein
MVTGADARPAPRGDDLAMTYATLSARTVAGAMHVGVLTCSPTTPLREAARTMARHRVHALVVSDGRPHGVWGVVSDVDVLAAIVHGELDTLTAGGSARTPLVVTRGTEPLRRVAGRLREAKATHAVVVGERDEPVGILSTLDLARAVAQEPDLR